MKRHLLASAAAVFLSASAAHAEGWYMGVLGGPSFDPHLSVGGTPVGTDTGYNFGLRAGLPIGNATPTSGLALEADGFFSRAKLTGQHAHVSTDSGMADLVYRVATGTPFDVYGGGGAGIVRTGYDGPVSGASTRLGWQALGGVEYNISPSASLFAEYRYRGAPDIHVGTTSVSDVGDDVSFGVKFNM